MTSNSASSGLMQRPSSYISSASSDPARIASQLVTGKEEGISWSQSNPGAIAGIVVGVGLLLAWLVFFLVAFLVSRRDPSPADEPRHSFTFMPSSKNQHVSPPVAVTSSVSGVTGSPPAREALTPNIMTRWSLVGWIQNDLFAHRSRANSAASGEGGRPSRSDSIIEEAPPLQSVSAAGGDELQLLAGRVGHLSPGGPSSPALLQAVAQAVLSRDHVYCNQDVLK